MMNFSLKLPEFEDLISLSRSVTLGPVFGTFQNFGYFVIERAAQFEPSMSSYELDINILTMLLQSSYSRKMNE